MIFRLIFHQQLCLVFLQQWIFWLLATMTVGFNHRKNYQKYFFKKAIDSDYFLLLILSCFCVRDHLQAIVPEAKKPAPRKANSYFLAGLYYFNYAKSVASAGKIPTVSSKKLNIRFGRIATNTWKHFVPLFAAGTFEGSLMQFCRSPGTLLGNSTVSCSSVVFIFSLFCWWVKNLFGPWAEQQPLKRVFVKNISRWSRNLFSVRYHSLLTFRIRNLLCLIQSSANHCGRPKIELRQLLSATNASIRTGLSQEILIKL